MRAKGSKDKNKRKVKNILGGTEERDLIKDYEQGYSISDLRKKYNISKPYISSMFKSRNIKKRIYQTIIKQWELIENIEDLEKNISGVYGICFIHKIDPNDIKLYIGSSVDIKARLKTHYASLNKNNHDSQMLYSFFTNENYSLVWTIIEKCSETLILQREKHHLYEHNKSCLINTSIPTKEEDLRPWLEKAVTLSSYKKDYTVNNYTQCKESNFVHISGYARIDPTIKGVTKYFYKHRVAYWEKYGEYPELIRHKCNNPKCYNADHLESGNHRDNSLDRRGDFPEVFEKAWVELNGDMIKLTEHFSDRWIANSRSLGTMVCGQIYGWEKKLGLREKYPEILDGNKDRCNSNGVRKKRNNDFSEVFEKAWVELNGDPIKLTERFSDRWIADKIIPFHALDHILRARWIADKIWRGTMVCEQIYIWEKKLGLREKYPEILAPPPLCKLRGPYRVKKL